MMMVAAMAASVSTHNNFASLVAVLVMIVISKLLATMASVAMMVIMRNVGLAGVSAEGRCPVFVFVHFCLRRRNGLAFGRVQTAQ